jgi:hypothetical protein
MAISPVRFKWVQHGPAAKTGQSSMPAVGVGQFLLIYSKIKLEVSRDALTAAKYALDEEFSNANL